MPKVDLPLQLPNLVWEDTRRWPTRLPPNGRPPLERRSLVLVDGIYGASLLADNHELRAIRDRSCVQKGVYAAPKAPSVARP